MNIPQNDPLRIDSVLLLYFFCKTQKKIRSQRIKETTKLHNRAILVQSSRTENKERNMNIVEFRMLKNITEGFNGIWASPIYRII